ncbi:hypothetical protein [Kitasatospora sp. NPDC059673]|uniref:hypothetical protein n=1 Tax=Kitasatospora sp. NPDC059673 TaxID=3346901 RepID=UPI0036AF1BD6
MPDAAELAGPLQLDTERLTRAVRRRRRTRSTLTAGAVLALAGAVFTVAGQAGPAGPAAASPGAGGAGANGSASGQSFDSAWGQKCGQPLSTQGTAPTIESVKMSVRSVQRLSNEAGPAIDAALSTERTVHANGWPAPGLEALYLKDGVVVGGGPVRIGRGDPTPPPSGELMGQVWVVREDRPFDMKLREQNTLCPSVTWPQIWAHPGDYEVVLLLRAPVVALRDSNEQVLIARAPLAR